jgi:hypothetical protein
MTEADAAFAKANEMEYIGHCHFMKINSLLYPFQLLIMGIIAFFIKYNVLFHFPIPCD